ncbi:keratin, type I cytoskeletal 18 [Neoarius graeffei]|uniref:keratin, type I cytoskeletal 18 n=1 Tax=Neoarius graeffei TaxID=443677 RepID=UPI00298CF360|nr:keratin, type I cytoskeletal 18 [Neoarius graeffei]
MRVAVDTIKIGMWNVRTLRESGRIELLQKETETYKCDILAVQEVRCFQLVNIAVVQVYAPASDSSDADIDEFYAQLNETLDSIPWKDVKLVLGDWDAKTGTERDSYEEALGSKQELGVTIKSPGQMFGFLCRCMMEVCEGQQEVLRDLNKRLNGFLEHVAQLQKINLNLQEQIAAWKTPLERDWSSQERTVEELQAQISHMLMENAELALHSDRFRSIVHHLQSRCELEQKLRFQLEQLILELRQKRMNLDQANTLLEEQLHMSTLELHTMQQERELFVQQQQAAVGEDGRGMELRRFGPAHGDLSSAALTNQAPGYRPTAHTRPKTDTPSPNRDQPPQVSRGDEALREARAELTEVRKQWHSLQVEVESLHAMERSLQSSLKHTQHQYSLQLQDLSRSVCELEAELDGVREGLAAQKQHHNQLLNTKMRLEREITTYRRLLEHEEGRFLSVEVQPQTLKPWKPWSQQNGVCNGFEKESSITDKLANQGPAFHRQGNLVIFTEPIVSRDGEISTVKTQEIVEGNVVRESAEGHGRVETEKIDKVIKQWEGSFFQGNPKLRKKSVSLRFDLHMAVADEGCAQSKQDSLPDVEVRLVMKRSRSIPSITQ